MSCSMEGERERESERERERAMTARMLAIFFNPTREITESRETMNLEA